MNLDKDKEILDLNIKEAGKKMPPDVLHALKIGSEAINYIIRLRACSFEHRAQRLPSEYDVDPTKLSEEEKKKLRESPLGNV